MKPTTPARADAGQNSAQISVKLETNSEDMHLKRTIDAVMRLNPVMRATVAEMIRARGYEAHIGGRHVAILDGTMRLAFFTGTSPDFN